MSWPQVEAMKLVEKHLYGRTGKVLTIRSSRQTMKNEVSATVEDRFLLRRKLGGGIIVKTAPTYKPQIVNSKRRLDLMIRKDPLMPRLLGYKEGYIKEFGNASVQFLSAEKGSNVEGATASWLLEIDEAHKTDKGKFQEAFAPMTASTGAATVMYGVAAAKNDLLYEQREHNERVDKSLNLQFPADIWCEINPDYARHYSERVLLLGEDHPVILTQYRLIDIESIGGFFSRWQISNLLSGEHQRKTHRQDEKFILVTIDIAGEDEEGEDLSPERGEAKRDQTVALIWEVDWTKERHGIPQFRLLDLHWWVGAPLTEAVSGLPDQKTRLLELISNWRADKVVVDARGVGEETASYLRNNWGSVTEYKADINSVSDDCYATLAFVNNNQVKVFKNEKTDSRDYQELSKQIGHAAKEIKSHDKMALVKPEGSQSKHIDMVKAMTYLRHGLDNYVIGTL